MKHTITVRRNIPNGFKGAEFICPMIYHWIVKDDLGLAILVGCNKSMVQEWLHVSPGMAFGFFEYSKTDDLDKIINTVKSKIGRLYVKTEGVLVTFGYEVEKVVKATSPQNSANFGVQEPDISEERVEELDEPDLVYRVYRKHSNPESHPYIICAREFLSLEMATKEADEMAKKYRGSQISVYIGKPLDGYQGTDLRGDEALVYEAIKNVLMPVIKTAYEVVLYENDDPALYDDGKVVLGTEDFVKAEAFAIDLAMAKKGIQVDLHLRIEVKCQDREDATWHTVVDTYLF